MSGPRGNGMEGLNMAKLACQSVVPMNKAVKIYFCVKVRRKNLEKSWQLPGVSPCQVRECEKDIALRCARNIGNVEKVRLSLCTVRRAGLLPPLPWPSKPSPPGERPLPAVGTPATTCPPSAGCSELSGRRGRNLAEVPYPPLRSPPSSKAGGRGAWPWT